ncbi:MAG: MdpB, partial [Pseudomonadota bacterium]
MAEPFLAEIRVFSFTFAPRGWAFCNGQIMPISQNAALFSLIGVNFGGNGTSNFGLPNLQGNAPLHAGQGPTTSSYSVGQTGGVTQVTLSQSEIPIHTHTLNVSSFEGTEKSPRDTYAAGFAGVALYGPAVSPNVTMFPTMLALSGGNQAHDNMMPYLAL